MKENGLLLVNLGSPATPTTPDVKEYLKEFLSDQNVVEMPKVIWQPILKGIILPMRSWRSATFYRDCWQEEGSPLIINTKKLTVKVQDNLPDWDVEMAMTYGHPSIPEVLEKMKKNCQHITVLPLFPFFTKSTTQTIIEKVKYAAPDATTREIIKRVNIPEEKVQMAYQSKFGPMPWLKPYLKNTLLKEAQLGHRNILLVTPAFVADCLETLEEDGIQNYQSFRENGGDNLTLVPCLNDNSEFAQFLSNLAISRNQEH